MKYHFVISICIDSPSDAGQRIDKFLRKYLPNAPLGGIFKWIRTGKIKVGGKKVDQTYRLLEGDTIECFFSEEEIAGFQKKIEKPGKWENESRHEDLEVLYEDESLLVVNKPSALNVHPGDHKSNEVSLIELIQDQLGEKYNTLSFRPSLVHRIDRDTSGCIMIAKEKKALEKLLSLLGEGKIKKRYHAVVIGSPSNMKGTIDAKLLRITDAKDEAKVRVDEGGQKAITHYHVLKQGINNRYSLIECDIETGRTHQIRVHLAHLGHPILGDKAYGNPKENSFARREYDIHRQLLHAYSLSLPHPVTGKPLTIEAPYMSDMKQLLEGEESSIYLG